MANLTHGKSKELTQLLSDDRFAAAFYALVDFPGLWRPIQLGTLHRLLTLKCEEVRLDNWSVSGWSDTRTGNVDVSGTHQGRMDKDTDMQWEATRWLYR